MLNAAINKFNQIRRAKRLNNALFSSKKKYAFVGAGMHSITNLYPILHHFCIPLKYIYTKSSNGGLQLKKQFPTTVFTHNFSDILDDAEVEAVFVCSTPSSHFSLLQNLGKNGKKIFVEKPPCQTLKELEVLTAIQSLEVCKVGLQRRFWPGNKFVLQKIKKSKSYQYSFQFGNYITGDPYTELFIHALDYCSFLFGNYKVLSSNVTKYNGGETLHMHVMHNQGISGLIEASTNSSWNRPTDMLTINCIDETIEVQYPNSVTGFQKPKRILNIPTERILHQPELTKKYFGTGNGILPNWDLNTLMLQGFYHEVENFITLVENGKDSQTTNDLPGLLPLYKILDKFTRE